MKTNYVRISLLLQKFTNIDLASSCIVAFINNKKFKNIVRPNQYFPNKYL